jgi:hypothetical protein
LPISDPTATATWFVATDRQPLRLLLRLRGPVRLGHPCGQHVPAPASGGGHRLRLLLHRPVLSRRLSSVLLVLNLVTQRRLPVDVLLLIHRTAVVSITTEAASIQLLCRRASRGMLLARPLLPVIHAGNVESRSRPAASTWRAL